MSYVGQILVGVDQLANAVLGGYADETISARAWRLQDENDFWGWFRKLIDGIFFWSPDHCHGAFRAEQLRRQSPTEEK